MIDHWRQRYQRWEQRHAARFAGWPVRRRWAVLVLAPTLVLCCCGTVVGAPLVWFWRATVDAGAGAPSPDAAASAYLDALGYGREAGLLPLLDDEHQGELLTQWRTYRAEMAGTDPPPAKLTFGTLVVGPVVGGRADVTVDVAALWWPAGGGGTLYRSELRTWRIEARQADGWRVSAVQAPAWCGGYVLADRCRTR